jgi:capsid portal protein
LSEHHAQGQKRRASRDPKETRKENPRDIIAPPFDLNALSDLLFDSADYYSIVDQLATDAAGNAYDLVDRTDPDTEQPNAPEQGDINSAAGIRPLRSPFLRQIEMMTQKQPIMDARAIEERKAARRFIDSVCMDFQGNRIKPTALNKCALMDYDSHGDGYLEIARDETDPERKVIGIYHIPSRLIRKRMDGTFCQVDGMGRAVAFFRPFQSDPGLPSSTISREEAVWGGQKFGDLKNELVNFRRYHPGELFYGVPPIIAALVNVYGNIFSDDRNLRFFVNRALPDWIVQIKANRNVLTDPASAEIIDQYEAALREHLQYVIKGDDYRCLVLRLPNEEVEVEWEKLSEPQKDSDFQEYQGRNRDVIIRVYRMLPHRMGIIETASLGSGTGETQEETYKRAQIDPRQQMIDDFWNKLIEERGWKLIAYKSREIDVTDEQREMQLFSAAVASQVISVNEAREWLSRIVKDQDFPECDEDEADIPMWISESRQSQAAIETGAFGAMQPGPRIAVPGLPGLSLPVTAGQGSAATGGNGAPAGSSLLGLPSPRPGFPMPGKRGEPDAEFGNIRRRLAAGLAARRARGSTHGGAPS